MTEAEGYRLLFYYLDRVLKDPERASLLDVPTNDDLDFQAHFTDDQIKIKHHIEKLRTYLIESHQFGQDLASGIIEDARIPSRANYLAAPLKSAHNSLSHLIWLMEEVADGDYTQRLNAGNDLSKAFNSMVEYLLDLSLRDRLTGLLTMDGFISKGDSLLSSPAVMNSRKTPSLDSINSHNGSIHGEGGRWFVSSFNVKDLNRYTALYYSKKTDALLKQISGFVQNVCKENELCARLHGSVYAALLYCASGEEVNERLNGGKISDPLTLSDLRPMFKIGIFPVIDPNAGMRQMLDCAIFACETISDFESREYAVFDENMRRDFLWQNEVITSCQDALNNEEFQVYYQPKVDVRDGKVRSAEALTRWIRPKEGLIMPAKFIPIFERTGFVTKLDFYILNHVCSMLKRRGEEGLPPVRIAINFARIDLFDTNFKENVEEVLDYYGIDHRQIEIEITETLFVDKPEELLKLVHSLRDDGFVIAMDDFGTGYSTFNMLKDIPIDVLKIDRLFFKDFGTDSRARYIIENILLLAKHLNLITVAEGVEEKSQVDFLKKIGCESIQGFYFYKPMPLQDFSKVLEERCD